MGQLTKNLQRAQMSGCLKTPIQSTLCCSKLSV